MATKKTSKTEETKVVCPVCGTEFAIGEHEHVVNKAVAIGKDSGLGTIVLPVSKAGSVRIDTMAAQGVDMSKYFSINTPNGGTTLMKWEDGKPVAVDASDPVMQNILRTRTIPNRRLFRRWVTSQVFHGLASGNFTKWLKHKGYKYQWKMVLEEMRVQAKLAKRDPENFAERNCWFNAAVICAMARHYLMCLDKEIKKRPRHTCKGKPYIAFYGKNYFITDIERKLYKPVRLLAGKILACEDATKLYALLVELCSQIKYLRNSPQCPEWMDSYKGMGAFAVMKNLLLFHDCKFPIGNDFYERNEDPIVTLNRAAKKYSGESEGWRMFGLMKQCIEFNHIDIKAKMAQWYEEKAQKMNQ